VLVGWGGATDQDTEIPSIVYVGDQGAAAAYEGCTVQYHPDSKHMPAVMICQGSAAVHQPDNPLPRSVVVAEEDGHVDLLKCHLVGPTARGPALTGFGVRAGAHATTTTLVGMRWFTSYLVRVMLKSVNLRHHHDVGSI
jgi:hypothetical protein